MRRVVVLGSVGAGKSVLAREIGRRTGLPVVHLDRLFWRPGWMPAPEEDARVQLEAAIAADCWVLDGNFLDAGDSRFERADTVVFLDLPRRACLWNVLKRQLTRGRPRPDLPEGCSEGIDRDVLRWIWTYPRVDRPRVLTRLATLDERVAVHHLGSRAAVRDFLRLL